MTNTTKNAYEKELEELQKQISGLMAELNSNGHPKAANALDRANKELKHAEREVAE